MTRPFFLSALRVLVGAAALGLTAASASADTYDYDAVFADATAVTFDAQVAGTYPARSEVLVKLLDNNQYAIPVDPDSDLSMWRENDLIDVTVRQGLVLAISDTGGAEPGWSYEVMNETGEIDGIPEDVVVRKITLVGEIEEVDTESKTITFVAPAGDRRTAVVSDTVSLESVSSEGILEIVYLDEITVETKN